MKCGQGKPFKSYQMGGLVTKGPAKSKSTSLYLQPEDTSKPGWTPTDATGADRSTYSTKPMPGRNVYVGGSTPAARGGRGDPDAGVYTAKMGKPPMDVDMMTSLKPAQRKAAEARMKAMEKSKK